MASAIAEERLIFEGHFGASSFCIFANFTTPIIERKALIKNKKGEIEYGKEKDLWNSDI